MPEQRTGTGRRRSDLFVALAMLVAACIPGVCLYFVSTATWVAMLAGLLAIPAAFVGGVVATWGEQT